MHVIAATNDATKRRQPRVIANWIESVINHVQGVAKCFFKDSPNHERRVAKDFLSTVCCRILSLKSKKENALGHTVLLFCRKKTFWDTLYFFDKESNCETHCIFLSGN